MVCLVGLVLQVPHPNKQKRDNLKISFVNVIVFHLADKHTGVDSIKVKGSAAGTGQAPSSHVCAMSDVMLVDEFGSKWMGNARRRSAMVSPRA